MCGAFPAIDIDGIKDECKAKVFAEKLNAAPLPHFGCSVDDHHLAVAREVNKAALAAFGPKPKIKRREYLSQNTFDAVAQRRQAREELFRLKKSGQQSQDRCDLQLMEEW